MERLPAIKDTDIELLLDAIRSEQGTTQWRVDLDVLMGLVLVIDQGAFNKVWDTFAQSFSAWLRGSDTRQAARRAELRERLLMCELLQEELMKWRNRTTKRSKGRKQVNVQVELNSGQDQVDGDSQLLTHEMAAEDWQPEEVREQPQDAAAPMDHEDAITSLVGGWTSTGTQQQGEAISATEEVIVEPRPKTPEQTLTPTNEESEGKDPQGSDEEPIIHVPRKRARRSTGSDEDDTTRLVTEKRNKERVEQIVKELGIPHSSQWIETIHALLIVKKMAAAVYEPMLAVKDDELADVRAALWPSFRHMEAGQRDLILNECVKTVGAKDGKKLFVAASEKLGKAEPMPEFMEDVDSSLVAKPIYKCIGLCDGTVPSCNIVQQCASSMNSELHFEFLAWNNGVPMRHVRVEGNGDCWLVTILRQCATTWHGKVTWNKDGSPPKQEVPRLFGEVAREKRELKMRISFDNTLVTSFAKKCTWIFDAPLDIKERGYPVKLYGMLDAMRLEDNFKEVMSKSVAKLVKKGVPLEYAKTLWSIYGNEETALWHYKTVNGK